MSDSPDAVPEAAGTGGPATRDLLLVALAILALLVAAFALPPLGQSAAEGGESEDPNRGEDEEPNQGDGMGPNQGDGEGVDQDGGQPGDGRPIGIVSPGDDGRSVEASDGDGERYAVQIGDASEEAAADDGRNASLWDQGGQEPYPGCLVVLWDRPVPGKEVSVFVWNDTRPVPDRRVWIGDRLFGRTSSAGRVDGRVPYERRVEIAVGAPDARGCRFLQLDRRTGFDAWVDTSGSAVLTVGSDPGTEMDRADGNVTAMVDVEGEAQVTVSGDPYPGETVRVNATVADVPMRRATVSVDGRAVGRTDDAGSYDLTVPTDGTEQLAVAVSRGDFEARTTVEVLQLSVAVRPAGPVAIPGGRATVVATFGDRPAPGATVSLGGETVGTAGADGRLSVDLPLDPRRGVQASAHGQTDSVAVWPLYVPLAVGSVLVLGAAVGSLAATRRRGSAGSTRVVAAIWGAVAVVLAGGLLDGRRGAALAAGAVSLLALCLGLVVYRDRVRASVGHALRWLVALGGRVNALARWLADVLVRLATWAGALVRRALDRLRALPRSVGALLALAWAWLRDRPRRALAALRRLLAGVYARGRRLASLLLTPRGAGAVALVLAAAAAGFVVADVEGAAVAAVAAVVLVAAVAWTRSRDRTTGGSTASETAGLRPPPSAESGDGAEADWQPSLRDLWRRFARRVVPGRWRTRTPGEVARTAVDRGFPAGPVDQLTDAFRAVEYGDRSPSDELRDRARTAFEAIRADRGEEVDEP